MKFKPSTRAAGYVRAALKCGHWEDAEQKNSHEAFLRHIESGVLIGYPMHDGGSDYNSARNSANAMSALCGCKFVEARGRKRSRKADQHTDFDVTQAVREQRAWHREHDAQIEHWQQKRSTAIATLKRIEHLKAEQREQALEACAQIIDAETHLRELHQIVEPFDPAEVLSW